MTNDFGEKVIQWKHDQSRLLIDYLQLIKLFSSGVLEETDIMPTPALVNANVCKQCQITTPHKSSPKCPVHSEYSDHKSWYIFKISRSAIYHQLPLLKWQNTVVFSRKRWSKHRVCSNRCIHTYETTLTTVCVCCNIAENASHSNHAITRHKLCRLRIQLWHKRPFSTFGMNTYKSGKWHPGHFQRYF